MGADAASWSQALYIESNRAQGNGVSGAALDVFKAFDQLSREAVFEVAKHAGLPVAFLSAWYRLMHAMTTRNCLGAAVGQAYGRPASVPQGCPLSMCWLALVMRPAMLLALSLDTVPS